MSNGQMFSIRTSRSNSNTYATKLTSGWPDTDAAGMARSKSTLVEKLARLDHEDGSPPNQLRESIVSRLLDSLNAHPMFQPSNFVSAR